MLMKIKVKFENVFYSFKIFNKFVFHFHESKNAKFLTLTDWSGLYLVSSFKIPDHWGGRSAQHSPSPCTACGRSRGSVWGWWRVRGTWRSRWRRSSCSASSTTCPSETAGGTWKCWKLSNDTWLVSDRDSMSTQSIYQHLEGRKKNICRQEKKKKWRQEKIPTFGGKKKNNIWRKKKRLYSVQSTLQTLTRYKNVTEFETDINGQIDN